MSNGMAGFGRHSNTIGLQRGSKNAAKADEAGPPPIAPLAPGGADLAGDDAARSSLEENRRLPSRIYQQNLDRNRANYAALTPLSFLARTSAVYPDKLAVVHGDLRFTYAEFRDRCHRLASALARRGIGPGDTVAIMAPNVPAML